MANKSTYYLNTGPNGRYQEVTMEEFVRAERAAGFHPKDGMPIGKPATGGFGVSGGVCGKVIYKLDMSNVGFKAKETKQ